MFLFSLFPKASSPPQCFWEVHSNTINMGLFIGFIEGSFQKVRTLLLAKTCIHILCAHSPQHVSLYQEWTPPIHLLPRLSL